VAVTVTEAGPSLATKWREGSMPCRHSDSRAGALSLVKPFWRWGRGPNDRPVPPNPRQSSRQGECVDLGPYKYLSQRGFNNIPRGSRAAAVLAETRMMKND
jgi:hypothetical protein